MKEMRVQSLGGEDPLENEMATHPSNLAWRTPLTEKPVRIQSMGSQKSWTQLNNSTTYININDIINHWYFVVIELLSCVWLFATLWTAAHQASLSFVITRVCSSSCPLSRWCHPTISSSVVPFSSGPQSFPVSESFPRSQHFASGDPSIGASVSASVLPKNTQDWSPSQRTGWISLQSKGLSRVLSNTTVQRHQFFGAQPSSQSNSHIHTRPQEKP